MSIRRVFAITLIFTWIFSSVLPASAARGNPPSSAFVAEIAGREVNGYPQTFALSCESRSAVDLAAFWGVEIREREFIKRLPRSDNPQVGFVGDPNGVWGYLPPYSYGVHASPIAKLLNDYGLFAQAHSGFSWPDLQNEIAAGRPVIVWVIGEMWPGKPTLYKAQDGENVQVANFEHTMIITGYNQKKVEAIDAFSGQAKRYPVEKFLKSWQVLGNMAVTAQIWDPGQLVNHVYLSSILVSAQSTSVSSVSGHDLPDILAFPGMPLHIRLVQETPRQDRLAPQ